MAVGVCYPGTAGNQERAARRTRGAACGRCPSCFGGRREKQSHARKQLSSSSPYGCAGSQGRHSRAIPDGAASAARRRPTSPERAGPSARLATLRLEAEIVHAHRETAEGLAHNTPGGGNMYTPATTTGKMVHSGTPRTCVAGCESRSTPAKARSPSAAAASAARST